MDLGSEKKVEFVPNSEYTRYIPKDLNFEDVCFRAAVLKQPVHNCVHMPRYPFDIMAYLMPLESGDENLGYCTYTQVLVPKTDNNLMAMNISQETAMNIIGTCIKLREDKPFREIMQEVIFYSIAETWQDTLNGSFCLIVRDEQDMEFIREKNPKWYRSLMGAGVERLVLFPLMPRGQFLGYIFAINFLEEKTQHIRDTLELTTYFIASEIANNRFIEQLQTLNKMDLLTGVMNRNAMNSRIAAAGRAGDETNGPMGVIFADMNGLKYTNDHHGHSAGDLLLKNAAMILQNTFIGDEIYRVGGDEFLILLQDTDEEEMRRKIAEMKKKAEMFDNVRFAAGYSLVRPGMDLREALAEADARMYQDKEDYYREHPEMKRRTP